MKRPTNGQNIALSVTVLAAILLILLLLGVHLDFGNKADAPQKEAITMAMPEEIDPLDEEMFIEPELTNLGDPENTATDESEAPIPSGTPDISDVPNDKLVVNGPNPNPNKESEHLATTTKPSDVKTTASSAKDDPDQRLSDTMSSQFNMRNGKSEGTESTAVSGKGGDGKAEAKGEIQGQGRKLLNHPQPEKFSVTRTTIVKVTVMVKADGTVKPDSANCVTSLKDPDLKKNLEKASEKTKWTSKKGAPTVQATIIWTLYSGKR